MTYLDRGRAVLAGLEGARAAVESARAGCIATEARRLADLERLLVNAVRRQRRHLADLEWLAGGPPRASRRRSARSRGRGGPGRREPKSPRTVAAGTCADVGPRRRTWGRTDERRPPAAVGGVSGAGAVIAAEP